MINKFSKEVSDKLQYYVYRLVDPRTGLTFYVGKGKGNRVFNHAAGAIKFSKTSDSEDELTAKIKQIQDIIASNLEVITIIHRHGMDEETALEVEGALIDAYPGLTNIQNGHGNSEYGCASAVQIQKMYEAEEAEIPALKYLIIKIKQSTIDERGSIYEAVRMHWHINEKQAKGRIVLASVAGIIRGVFTVQDWLPSTECEGRMYFVGQEASNEVKNLFIGKRLPKKFIKKGAASPVRYS